MTILKKFLNRVRRHPVARLINQVWLTFMGNHGTLFARGIAFSILITSIPFLFIAIYLSSLVLADSTIIYSMMQKYLTDVVPAHISDMLFSQTNAFILNESWRNIGLLGFFIMLWTPHNLYSAFESGLRGVMKPPKITPFFWRHLLHFASHFMVIVIFFFFAFIAITLTSLPIQGYYTLPPESWSGLIDLLRILTSRILVTVVITLTLASIYRMSYHNPIRYRVLLGVSLSIASIWQFINVLGAKFISASGRQEVVYGILAGGIMMLVWAYLFSILLLVGGIFISQLEKAHLLKEEIKIGKRKRGVQRLGRKNSPTLQIAAQGIDKGKGRAS